MIEPNKKIIEQAEDLVRLRMELIQEIFIKHDVAVLETFKKQFAILKQSNLELLEVLSRLEQQLTDLRSECDNLRAKHKEVLKDILKDVVDTQEMFNCRNLGVVGTALGCLSNRIKSELEAGDDN